MSSLQPGYAAQAWRFLRRNGRRIAVISAAAAATAVAVTYAHRQYAAMNAALARERAAGATGLRARFVANANTVYATLCALLPVVQGRVFACPAADADALVAVLKAGVEGREKKQGVWEALKVAALTRLVSSLYLVAMLHSVLLLQVNLLARYSSADMDAPIEALPAGELGMPTKQRFLALARRRLFCGDGVETVVRKVEAVVRAEAAGLGLKVRLGREDVAALLRRVCDALYIELAADAYDEDGSGTEKTERAAADNLFDATWLLSEINDDGTLAEPSSTGDVNFRALVDESLDMCDFLDFGGLVCESADIALAHALSDINENLWKTNSAEENRTDTRALAQLLAHINNASSAVLGTLAPEAPDALGDVTDLASGSALIRALGQSEASERFAASVFLSGEREDRPPASRVSETAMARVAPASARQAGTAAPAAPREDELGLMFELMRGASRDEE